jgi:hypothetical protein
VIQLSSSEISMTRNSERVYSPVLSGEKPIGTKARTAMKVAPSKGMAVCWVISLAALMRSMPREIRTRMPSVTTIALSTSMPSAMISAPGKCAAG